MATYVRIENGELVETRQMTLEEIPLEKRSIWRLLVNNPPAYNSFYQDLQRTGYDITPTTVTVLYQIVQIPVEDLKKLVRAEEVRRLRAITPSLTDLNDLLLRRVVMLRSPRDFTNQQIAAVDTQIDAIINIKNKSATVQAMNPIPSDYTANSYWT